MVRVEEVTSYWCRLEFGWRCSFHPWLPNRASKFTSWPSKRHFKARRCAGESSIIRSFHGIHSCRLLFIWWWYFFFFNHLDEMRGLCVRGWLFVVPSSFWSLCHDWRITNVGALNNISFGSLCAFIYAAWSQSRHQWSSPLRMTNDFNLLNRIFPRETSSSDEVLSSITDRTKETQTNSLRWLFSANFTMLSNLTFILWNLLFFFSSYWIEIHTQCDRCYLFCWLINP